MCGGRWDVLPALVHTTGGSEAGVRRALNGGELGAALAVGELVGVEIGGFTLVGGLLRGGGTKVVSSPSRVAIMTSSTCPRNTVTVVSVWLIT